MALVQLNQRLGALLAILPSFDVKDRKRHLIMLRDKYGLTMSADNGYNLSNEHVTVKVQFNSGPLLYATLTRTDIAQQPVYINIASTSQLELEDWFESVFSVLTPIETAKRAAGYKAVNEYVRNAMAVGLGTGSTAFYAVERVGQKVRLGLLEDIVCIPTSERTREQAVSLNLDVRTLDELGARPVDVAIDGADAVDLQLNLIKGGGGALLREKMIEVAALKFICIVDYTKLCTKLGPSFPLPVEVVPFCFKHTMRILQNIPGLICTPRIRTGNAAKNLSVSGEAPAVTDNKNHIIDLVFADGIEDPGAIANSLRDIVGVVEHGLFCSMAQTVIVARQDGSCIQYGEGGLTPDW